MTIIKRLYTFILKSFLPLFAMTFFIVLFIVLMQFLWKYVDDLVGKGLPLDVIGELFFYAAVSMVPMALPLAILLASLMTFGNLGEKFELTAMKAAGISLLQVMRPLIVLISCIAVGAFFFQNDVLPHAQVKMWTLLFSMKQKSPEVEIPEGVFYDEIPGYNLFVKKKNAQTGMLKNVMIYDVTKGGNNVSVLLADSARLAFTKDNRYLYLRLYRGEQFETLKGQTAVSQNVPFRREQFADKEVLIPFDANFNRMDDQGMRKQYVGKNIAELQQTIDSVTARVDSIGNEYSRTMLAAPIVGVRRAWIEKKHHIEPFRKVTMPARAPQLDSLLAGLSQTEAREIFGRALREVQNNRQNYQFKSESMGEDKKSIRRHEIELLKKFTLSVACLIMFFIGAPLGAIIRKGGLGTPLVISVLLFLVYYIIDNTGYKMARDGHLPVWIGMWISTFILAPLGVYVTIKAMNDSAIFDKDAWLIKLRRLLGHKPTRTVPFKEVLLNAISLSEAARRLSEVRADAAAMIARMPLKVSYANYWKRSYDPKQFTEMADRLDLTVDYLTDCRDILVVSKLMDYPTLRWEWLYAPSAHPVRAKICFWFALLGIPLYLWGLNRRRDLRGELRKVEKVSDEIAEMLHITLAEPAERNSDTTTIQNTESEGGSDDSTDSAAAAKYKFQLPKFLIRLLKKGKK